MLTGTNTIFLLLLSLADIFLHTARRLCSRSGCCKQYGKSILSLIEVLIEFDWSSQVASASGLARTLKSLGRKNSVTLRSIKRFRDTFVYWGVWYIVWVYINNKLPSSKLSLFVSSLASIGVQVLHHIQRKNLVDTHSDHEYPPFLVTFKVEKLSWSQWSRSSCLFSSLIFFSRRSFELRDSVADASEI